MMCFHTVGQPVTEKMVFLGTSYQPPGQKAVGFRVKNVYFPYVEYET